MLLFTTVIAYRTRRYHNIVCENQEVLTEICALRFGYERVSGDTLEPNWGIYRQRHILESVHEQMRYGNLCPQCQEWHHGPRCKVVVNG